MLESHLLPFFGERTIEEVKQVDVDAFARAELDRGMAIRTVNNRLAVLSTLIKYATSERSKLRFKLSGLNAEIRAVDAADVDKLLAACNDPRYKAYCSLPKQDYGSVRSVVFSGPTSKLVSSRFAVRSTR